MHGRLETAIRFLRRGGRFHTGRYNLGLMDLLREAMDLLAQAMDLLAEALSGALSWALELEERLLLP